MTEAARPVHFVGTYPALNERLAMSAMLEGIGGAPLLCLPDGETGEREDWIARTAKRQQENPALEVVVHGTNEDYENVWVHKVVDPDRFTSDSWGLDYADAVSESKHWLDTLAQAHGRPGLPLQVGVPNAIDHVLFMLRDGLPYIEQTTQAVADQINKAAVDGENNVIVQIESPATLTVAHTPDRELPYPLRRDTMAGYTADLVRKAHNASRFGLHLCLGDLNNRSLFGTPLTSGEPVVGAVTALMEQWPNTLNRPRLEYIHFPLAGGDQPPLDDQRIYQELSGLRYLVPEDTLIIAGLAHENQALDTQLRLRDRLEECLDRQVGIAAACGIARRRETPEAAAEAIMTRMRELAYL